MSTSENPCKWHHVPIKDCMSCNPKSIYNISSYDDEDNLMDGDEGWGDLEWTGYETKRDKIIPS